MTEVWLPPAEHDAALCKHIVGAGVIFRAIERCVLFVGPTYGTVTFAVISGSAER